MRQIQFMKFLSNIFPWYYIPKQCEDIKNNTPFLNHTFFKMDKYPRLLCF